MSKLLDRDLLLRECQETLSRFNVNFSIIDVISKSRAAEDVFVRALICYILKQRGYNLAQIGEVIGGRTHATVINALKYGEDEKQGSWRYQQSYKQITGLLESISNKKSLDDLIKFHESEHKRLSELKKNLSKRKNEQRKS